MKSTVSVLVTARGHHHQKRVSRPALQINSGEYSGRTHIDHPLQFDSGKCSEELGSSDGGGLTGLSEGTGTCGRELSGNLLR